MKILLTLPYNASYKRDMPDLGLGYLAACLKKEGHEVQLFLRVQRFDYERRFLDLARSERFDVYGIKVISSSIISAKRTINLIRSIDKDAIVILGGPQVSADTANIFNLLSEADYAFYGEAEIGLIEFLRKFPLASSNELSMIPNLIWKNGPEVKVNQGRFIEDLDALPFPSWDLMKPRDFPNTPINCYSKRWPIAPIILSRGCDKKCTYCCTSAINGRKIRSRTAGNLIEEIKLLMGKYSVKELQFVDSNCAHPLAPLREICSQLISEKIDIVWSAPYGICIDSINEGLAVLMKKSRCHQVSVGIESASPRMLEQINKRQSLEMIRKNVGILRNAGIDVMGFFILGFPGETHAEMRQTVSFARELPLTSAAFSIFSPFPGSDVYKQLFKDKSMDIETLNSLDFVNYKNNLSEVSHYKLRKIQRKAYLQFYLRPQIVKYFLKNLNSIDKILFLINRIRFILK